MAQEFPTVSLDFTEYCLQITFKSHIYHLCTPLKKRRSNGWCHENKMKIIINNLIKMIILVIPKPATRQMKEKPAVLLVHA